MVDFWDLTKLLARRWMIALPMLVLSAVLTVQTVGRVQPDYVATAYVQLVAPGEVAVKPGEPFASQRNPWLSQGLETVGNAAIITVLDKTVVDEMESAGLSDSYTVQMGATTPMVSFEVVGDSEQQARQTAERLVARFTQSVAKLQADRGVTAKDEIQTFRLDRGTNVEESTSKIKRALVAAAGAGLLMTVAVTVGADALLRRRRRAADHSPTAATMPPAQVRRDPAPAAATVAPAQVGPRATGPVETSTNGMGGSAYAERTARIFRTKAGKSSPPIPIGATAEDDQTARILGAKTAGETPAKDTRGTAAVVDYPVAGGGSNPSTAANADNEDKPHVPSLELTADATVVLQRSLPPKPDWPVRNGEQKNS